MLSIDAIAKRYGILPHEVLEMEPWDLGLARLCIVAARSEAAEAANRMSQAGGMIPMPVPVVVIGG